MEEKELEDYLIENIDIIEPGLQLIHRQYPSKYGIIDLLCKDKYKNIVVIEVKVESTVDAPGQLARYIYAIKQEYPNSFVRGILVSSKITKEVWELCNFFNVNFKELNNLNIPLNKIDLNELFSLKLPTKKELLHDIKLKNISLLNAKILKILENFEDGITTKHLAKILYPNKKFDSVRSTLSIYTSNLEKLGFVKKEKFGKETFIYIKL